MYLKREWNTLLYAKIGSLTILRDIIIYPQKFHLGGRVLRQNLTRINLFCYPEIITSLNRTVYSSLSENY